MSSVFNINKYIREKIKFFNNKMKFLQKFEIVIFYFIISLISHNGDWGLGIGDWGLGIGDWAQSPLHHHSLYSN